MDGFVGPYDTDELKAERLDAKLQEAIDNERFSEMTPSGGARALRMLRELGKKMTADDYRVSNADLWPIIELVLGAPEIGGEKDDS